MSTAHPWRDQGKPQQARELLVPVHSARLTNNFQSRPALLLQSVDGPSRHAALHSFVAAGHSGQRDALEPEGSVANDPKGS
jgi:hypothetical protein